ncbi:MAG: hypothetical protein C4K58_06115 [Flavobacteriaceae bacterium]|nr:MAG: hypothetical protein C4K58_06115 [Flavobacteriaceae bacterium]
MKWIAISGPTASGKSSLSQYLLENWSLGEISLLCLDWYYHSLPENIDAKNYNFDHPNAIDFDKFLSDIQSLENQNCTKAPMYSFEKHQRLEISQEVKPASYILVEGLHVLNPKFVPKKWDVSLYLDLEKPLQLQRKIQRDVSHRGRTQEESKLQFEAFCYPMQREFVEPQKTNASLVCAPEYSHAQILDFLEKELKH